MQSNILIDSTVDGIKEARENDGLRWSQQEKEVRLDVLYRTD